VCVLADNIVMFEPLQLHALVSIVEAHVRQLSKRLASQRVGLSITPAGARAVLAASYDPSFGARPIRRYVTNVVGTEVSRLIVSGKAKADTTIAVDASGDGQQLTYTVVNNSATGSISNPPVSP
jgi:ATP-dependent Clp protease ATP-binding subunit ClpB